MIQSTEKLLELINDKQIVDIISTDFVQGSIIDLRIGQKAKIRKDNEIIKLIDNPDLSNIYEEIDLAKGYQLKPGDYIYADSLEYVKIPKDMCGLIIGRSSFARIGLMLPISQYANPGYEGHLPIIIFNASKVTVEIPPYYRVMQLLLSKIEGTAKEYSKQIDAKYLQYN